MKDNNVKKIVRCPECQWRLLNTVTLTKGKIEIKCSRCKKVVEIDLDINAK